MIALGSMSRTAMMNLRGKLMSAGKSGKHLLGGILVVLGVLILTGLDKSLEAFMVQISPEWLTNLTTRF
jgi:cytochrome c-type biogenesis protein